jgi:uncharacterized protein YecT (DUF1311 family)
MTAATDSLCAAASGALASVRVLLACKPTDALVLLGSFEDRKGRPTVMKFTARFAVTGASIFALCLTHAYADSDAESEVISKSPRGTFRIERQGKRDEKGNFATTFWITSAADSSQRVQLDETSNEPDAWHFFISPDERWVCATVHEHSQLVSLRLYQRETGLQFKLVLTEGEETEGDDWKFDKDDRFAIKGDAEGDETGRLYNYFVAWSSDSARLLMQRRSQLEAKAKNGRYLWHRDYFYCNLRQYKLEHTQYLLGLNRPFRRYDSEQINDVVPAFAEPIDALPSEKELQQRYEAAEQRLNKIYPAFLKQADDETQNPNEKRERLHYQQLWLKARESGANVFAAMGPKAERPRRKLLYLADATENRAHDLEAYLEERALYEKENKEQAAEFLRNHARGFARAL